MNAQRSLHASGRELSEAMERLSTGKKINSAADDAAGFAIAESMTAQIRGLSMAAKNANDAQSLLSVVENATNDVTDILQRVRELAVQAQSDTNSDTDKANFSKKRPIRRCSQKSIGTLLTLPTTIRLYLSSTVAGAC